MALKSILIATLILLAASGQAAAGWITEIIHRVGIQRPGDGFGSWSSLAIDSNDVLHVSYYNVTRRNLRYAIRTGGVWSSRVVDRLTDVGITNALALDTFGVPSIAYSDFTLPALSFARQKPNGKFRIDQLRNEFTGAGGFAPSMVVNSFNHEQIIHHDYADFLWHLAHGGGGWTRTRLGNRGIQSGSSSLAISLGDTQHVAYAIFCPPPDNDCDGAGIGAQQWLVHTSNSGANGAWETEFVRPVSADGITCSSIGVDAQGAVHIVYVDRTDGVLKYETNASGLWKPRVLYNQSRVYGVSMKVDVRGDLRVSYTAGGPNGKTLKYATNSSGVWVHEVVDDTRNVGDVASIAIDGAGLPHISYYDATRGILRHALRQ